MSKESSVQRFAFRFEPRFRPMLAAVGVTPHTSYIEVGEGRLDVRFGLWRLHTDLANVTGCRQSGPYRWYRAIGARLSFSDRGVTFGSTTSGGVCISFAEPVPALDPLHVLRHPGLTVTPEDPAGLIAAIGR